MNKPKKIPVRKCVVTGERFPKNELIRVVRTPEGNVVIDLKGKANGRGAYVSKSLAVVDLAEKKKALDRELETTIGKDIYEELRKIIGESIE